MNRKARRSTARQIESSGGNVLFTLGLVSVIALLIVGWVMTQGGVGNLSRLTDKGGLISLPINPTPTQKTETSSIANSAALEQLKLQYEKRLRQERETAKKRIEELKSQYEKKIEDLELRIEILKKNNEQLRGA